VLGCLVFTVVVDDDDTQSSVEFLPELCHHGARDGVGFVPRGDNDADPDRAMLTIGGCKKMFSYAPESAAREDERKPDQDNDESAAEREYEHRVVIRYIQPILAVLLPHLSRSALQKVTGRAGAGIGLF
jgi:hypothetical protein